jgi:hypothetical protein
MPGCADAPGTTILVRPERGSGVVEMGAEDSTSKGGERHAGSVRLARTENLIIVDQHR